MKHLISLFVFCSLLMFASGVSAQHVHAYPKDGKIRDLKGKVQEDIVVAKDGSGDFLFIADALEAIRVYLPKPITVHIKEGVYKEKLEIPGTITNVIFKGDGPDKTIITFDDHTGKNKMDTFDSYTLMVWGNDLVFRDMTIQNTAGSVGQAVALHAEGDRLVFENCHFKGDQDTMFASGEGSRQYYKDCYIEGTTDFIFGSATAFFENCEIHSKSNSYITAASTPEWVDYGYVFQNCRLSAADGVNRVYLGRPWRDYAKTVFLQCEMGKHIVPEGWHNWGRPATEENTFYAEYQSKGPGANPDDRVKWSHQLSDEAAHTYSLEKVFSGKNSSKSTFGFPWYGYEKDTSFNLSSAYQKDKKQFPHIKKIEEENFSDIKALKDLSYKNVGYRDLSIDVFHPKKSSIKLRPGIILVHGGGWRSGNKSLQAPLAQALARKGYVTAAVEYRLSTEAKYPAAVKDVKSAIIWLKEHAHEFGMDTSQVAISGSSAGGQLAALVGFTNGKSIYEEVSSPAGISSDVHAVIDLDGVLAFHHPESSEGEVAAYWLGGNYEEVPEIWEEASALHQVGNNAVPVLFINSQYPRFHAGRDDMIKKLDQLNTYSEVHTFPDSPHPFWLYDPWFGTTVSKMDTFLKRIFK